MLDALKPLEFAGNRVVANLNRRERIFARGAGCRGLDETCIFAGERDGGARNNRAARILDGPENRARIDLRNREYAGTEQHRSYRCWAQFGQEASPWQIVNYKQFCYDS